MRTVITGDSKWQKEQQVEWKKTPYGTRAFIGDTQFDGHFVLWGFEFFPTTYLKDSELSGQEWRKGGEIRYFKDRKQCYSEFCRDPLLALNKAGATMLKLMDFFWEEYKVGQKVWYRELPCVVKMLCEDQGAAILERADGKNFPDAVWHRPEDYAFGEEEKTVKIDILESDVYWFRK